MIRIPALVVLMFVAIGCSTSTSAPRCVPGAVAACPCAESVMGAQSCGSGGTFGACSCDAPTRCTEGALFACACAGGTPGAQACNAAGTFDPCDCEAARGPGCIPGSAAPCSCESGAPGSQICGADEVFAACSCEAVVERCVPGRRVECVCADSGYGTQLCSYLGAYEACECAPSIVDGGVDADVDAAAPVCDPYAGEACGCPEVTPPTAPTLPRVATGVLATGTNTFIDFFVTAAGIVVVDSGGVVLLSRRGAELARWTSARQVISAAFDGTRFAIADRGAVTSLDLTLAVESTVFVAEPCTGGALLSCGRFVCAGGAEPWANYYSYDLPGGVELSRTLGTFGSATGRVARVPGVEAFVQVSSSFGYFPVDPSGAVGRPRGGFSTSYSDVFAFVGRPATHLVTNTGRMARLDVCLDAVPDAYPSPCLAVDGALGTLRGEQVFLAMDSGADGDLYAVTAARLTYAYDDACVGGCLVQRIDVDTRVVVSERALGLTGLVGVVGAKIRHDPWGGRALVSTRTGCEPSYSGVCTGWSISTVAFD